MVEDGAGQGTDGEEWSAIKRAKRDPRKITQAAQKQESKMGRKQTTPINDNKHTPGKGSTWSGTQGMEWRGMGWHRIARIIVAGSRHRTFSGGCCAATEE